MVGVEAGAFTHLCLSAARKYSRAAPARPRGPAPLLACKCGEIHHLVGSHEHEKRERIQTQLFKSVLPLTRTISMKRRKKSRWAAGS